MTEKIAQCSNCKSFDTESTQDGLNYTVHCSRCGWTCYTTMPIFVDLKTVLTWLQHLQNEIDILKGDL